MAAPLITQIASLKNMGVFRDFVADANLPDLCRLNLIYGFNGSGKSTIGRLLSSLHDGLLEPNFPQDGEFLIKLPDGSVIKEINQRSALYNKALVFNCDFVERNMSWKEGTAKSVFYIGKAQVDLADELEVLEQKKELFARAQQECMKILTAKEKELSTFKREIARIIEVAIGAGRKYNATALTADYAKKTYSESLRLPEESRIGLTGVLSQKQPLPKLLPLSDPSIEWPNLMADVQKLLSTPLSETIAKDINLHQNMLVWIRTGLDYHLEQSLRDCLFCGGNLHQSRINVLKDSIDSGFRKMGEELKRLKQKSEKVMQDNAKLKNSLPSANDIATTVRTDYARLVIHVKNQLDVTDRHLTKAMALISEKENAPNLIPCTNLLPPQVDFEDQAAELSAFISELNKLLLEHNKQFDDFNSEQEAARMQIKEHFLSDSDVIYRNLETEIKDATSKRDAANENTSSNLSEIKLINQRLRRSGPAADLMNKMITNYLGHPELEVIASDEELAEPGYEIHRRGSIIKGPLSEGEKTAISLCYFLSSIEADGRSAKDLLVVIDDPVSSLDTRALHYAFSMIKTCLVDVRQLIILTHNMNFMMEVKKWFRSKAGREGKADEAALLFIDCRKSRQTGLCTSTMRKLPKLIRDYESEYHYLFFLTVKFVDSIDAYEDYFYLMPNVLRKLLDVFLAFKVPGPEGLSSKIERCLRQLKGIDQIRVFAIDRLIQSESHADSLENILALSSLTLEETLDAAVAVIDLMKNVDKGHFEAMHLLCSGA